MTRADFRLVAAMCLIVVTLSLCGTMEVYREQAPTCESIDTPVNKA